MVLEKKSLGRTGVLSDTGAEATSCPCAETVGSAASGSKGDGEGHPQFQDTRMILDDLFLSEE